MRLKAIPQEAVKAVTAHPALVGGVLALGALAYLTLGRAAPADAAPSDGANVGAFTYGTPLAYGSIAGGTGAGGTGGGGFSGGTDPSVMAALAIQSDKNLKDFTLGMATLDAQKDAIAKSTMVALETVKASRFSALAGIAQAFLAIPSKGKSKNDFHTLSGSITDSAGNIINLNLNSALIDAGNKKAGTAISNIGNLMALENTFFTQGAQYVSQSAPSPSSSQSSGSNGGLPSLPSGSAVYGASSVPSTGTGTSSSSAIAGTPTSSGGGASRIGSESKRLQ